MEKASVLFMVETHVKPEDEEQYKEWHRNVHIPLVLKSPGMLRARRYQSLDTEDGQGTYLTIFEFENEAAVKEWDQGQTRKTAHQNKLDTWGDGGFTVNWAGYYNSLDT